MAVIWVEPYQVLGRMEAQVDKLNAYALTSPEVNSDVALSIVGRLRELHEQLSKSLQRSRLEEQLTASLELQNVRKNGSQNTGEIENSLKTETAHAENVSRFSKPSIQNHFGE
jgi:hypothetical protein